MGRTTQVLLLVLWQFMNLSKVFAATPLAGVEINVRSHSGSETLYDDDCYQYIIEDGVNIKTNNTDPHCCFYSSWKYDYYWSEYNGYYGPNEVVPHINCSTLVCVEKFKWEERILEISDCCEINGRWYIPDQTWYEDDCYQYTCQDGNRSKTNNTDPKCCYYNSWNYGNNWSEYRGYYGLNETVPHIDCSELVCVEKEKWEERKLNSSDCCEINGVWYIPNQTWYEDDCYQYTCQDGGKRKTNNTDPECCNYRPWIYGYGWNDENYEYSGYHGLNETVPHFNCSELVCVEKEKWEERKLNSSDCCEINGRLYIPNQKWYEDDCYQYTCQDREKIKTSNTDPECCYYGEDYSSFYGDDYYRYGWWYQDQNNWDDIYHDHHREKWRFGLNESTYTKGCQKKVCIARETWEITDERNQYCCEYDGDWYHHNRPVYKHDCIAYICQKGDWLKLNYTDPKCCDNPEWIGDDSEGDYEWYYQYNYEYWWVDYDFFQDWRNEDGVPSGRWFRVNSLTNLSNCEEVICAARDTWVTTGDVFLNCTPSLFECEFNGVTYNHSERLPGCMRVYCTDGNWLQNGYIDPKCDKCHANWDPHLKTFDGWHYDYHGTCDYALAQNGTSYDPQYGIFSKFYDCWGAACVGPSTYKDSPTTFIEMGADGRYTPQLYTLYVNGIEYVIPDNVPRQVMEGNITHPVFAWRYYGCIRLQGSSKLAVQKCGSTLSIWASSDFQNLLFGLCGKYDGDVDNDFTKRDLSQSDLEKYPSGSDFPDSWETTGNCTDTAIFSGRKKRETVGEENEACSSDNTTKVELQARCNETVGTAGDSMTPEELAVILEDCMFDMCTISQNTSGDPEALAAWFGDIIASVEETVEANNKTTDDEVIPEPLPRAPSVLPTTSPTTVNNPEELTSTSGTSNPTIPPSRTSIPTIPPSSTSIPTIPPSRTSIPTIPATTSTPDEEQIPSESEEEKPSQSNCNDGNCNIYVHVQMDVRIP